MDRGFEKKDYSDQLESSNITVMNRIDQSQRTYDDNANDGAENLWHIAPVPLTTGDGRKLGHI